jgi:hypothetical protein
LARASPCRSPPSGVPYGAQIKALARGLDVLVATPGRLEDHLDARAARLGATEFFVLDEADRMLDLGFVKAILRIIGTLPQRRQNLFFSATIPNEIATLAGDLLVDPVEVSVTPVATPAGRVNHQVMLVETSRKRDLLVELFADARMTRTIVFTKARPPERPRLFARREKRKATKLGAGLPSASVPLMKVGKIVKKMLPFFGTRPFLRISSGEMRTSASSGNAEKAL